MPPLPDVDSILILSLSVAAKRRPADLAEVIAAIALVQPRIPSASLLSDAFARLSACGLIVGSDGGYTLSADAQAMFADRHGKDDNDTKLARLAKHLAGYKCKIEHPALQVNPAQLTAAVREFKAEDNRPGKNLLTSKPKPRPVWIPQKELAPGKQHRASRRRKP